MKTHFKISRLKTPNIWLIITKDTSSFLGSKNLTFLTSDHLKIFIFYIRKILGKTFRKPAFLVAPRYWLSAKAKSSRMGKGKGIISKLIFPIQAGHRLLALPLLHIVLFIKLYKSLSIRAPFQLHYINSYVW